MAVRRTSQRNESKAGPPTEDAPRVNSESPDHSPSPGAGGGGSAKKVSAGQSYATAAMMAPASPTQQSETTKAHSSTKGTKKTAIKGKAAASGAAEETTVDNYPTASKANWTTSHEALKATVAFCRQDLPLNIAEKLRKNGITVPSFAISIDIVEAMVTGTPDNITAEILDEYKETLFRQWGEYIAEASTKTAQGNPNSAEATKQAHGSECKGDKPTSTAPVLDAQFRAPSDADMAKNKATASRAQQLSSTDSTADETMVSYAERLITSIAVGDHSAAQKHKVSLASSSARDLAIVPSNVVGPVENCATDGNGTNARVYSIRADSDDESDGGISLENSSDLGVRPRKPGKSSYNKEDVEAQARIIVISAIEALNAGHEEDVLPPETFKTDLVSVNKTHRYVIRVTPVVYVKIYERSVANRRIRDAVLKALRQLLEKRGALDSVSRSKLQAILTEHERIDSMDTKAQATFMCALPVDDDPSIYSIAFSQIAPGLNVGVNIIEQIHDALFDHENAQGISSVCRFISDVVVVKRKANGAYETLRTTWNRIMTQLQRHSKRSPLELPWNLYGFMVDDNGCPELLSHDNLARMLIIHITLKLSREPGYHRLQEKYAPTSLRTELVAQLGLKQLMELIEFAEKEVEVELNRTQQPEREAESTASQRKPVYNNLGNGAAFVATAEQAPFTSQPKAQRGPTREFVQGHDFFGNFATNEYRGSKNAVHAVIATARAVNDHSGGTVFESIGASGFKMKHGISWHDKAYADKQTTAGVRLLKDLFDITPSHYVSMLAGKPDLLRLKDALKNTTLQINTCKTSASQGNTTGKGVAGKGTQHWKGKGNGGFKATAAAASTHTNSSDGNSAGGYGGGSSSSKCEAI